MNRLLATALLATGLTAAIPAEQAISGSDPFLGQMSWFAGNFAPRGWALCDGQLLSINSNQALFSLLGTTYGGDGRTSFALPDVRSRVAIHEGQGPGLSTYRLGQRGGEELVTLNVTTMPSHTHSVQLKGASGAADGTDPAGSALASTSGALYSEGATPNAAMAANSVTEDNAGGNQAHENRMPYLTLNCIIALQGTFPSRN